MPNVSRESVVLQAVKILIGALSAQERAMLRPWLLAKFDVRGDEQRGFTDPKESK